MKKSFSTILMLFLSVSLFAQDKNIDMADALYANGKIYVVVATVAIILTGMFLFLTSIDRRLKKVEKKTGL